MVQVLVVEDEVIVGLALREELQDLGVRVVIENDAESAIELLSDATFDAAIIDVALPGMRGDQLARECRRLFPSMPIVLSTGMEERDIDISSTADAKLAILEKPYVFSALLECLERLGLTLGEVDSEPS